MPQTFYSKEEYEVAKTCIKSYTELVSAVARELTGNTQNMNENNQDKFGLIPMGTNSVINQFELVYKYHLAETNLVIQDPTISSYYRDEVKFLDAGCGIGHIMNLAYRWGWTSTGIELDKRLVPIAKQFGRVYNEDIIKFKNYKDYDVIYYYSPFMDNKLEKRFEKKIEDDCKVGCILICNRKQDERICKDKRFKKINKWEPIFVKVKEKVTKK